MSGLGAVLPSPDDFESAAGARVSPAAIRHMCVVLLCADAEDTPANQAVRGQLALLTECCSGWVQVVVLGLSPEHDQFRGMPSSWLCAPAAHDASQAARFQVPSRPYVVTLFPDRGTVVGVGPAALRSLLMDTDLEATALKKLAEQVAPGARHLALYFSAHWCGPCQKFTPVLADWYRRGGLPPEDRLMFVSQDHSERDAVAYAASGHPWPMVPYGSPHRRAFVQALGVTSIPALVVLEAATGRVVSRNGVARFPGFPGGYPWRWAARSKEGADTLQDLVARVGWSGGRTRLLVLLDCLDEAKGWLAATHAVAVQLALADVHVAYDVDASPELDMVRFKTETRWDKPNTVRLVCIRPCVNSFCSMVVDAARVPASPDIIVSFWQRAFGNGGEAEYGEAAEAEVEGRTWRFLKREAPGGRRR